MNPGDRRRAVLTWLAIGAAAVLVGLAVGPSNGGNAAFDPRSTSGNGTKAMVLLLRQLGDTVDLDVAPPGPDVQVAVVLHDALSSDRRDALRRWVTDGGTLIVADPTSDLQASAPVRVSSGLTTKDHVDGPCAAAGLTDVGRVDTGGSLFLQLPGRAVGCFPDRPGGASSAYLLVTARLGQGRFIGLGGAGLFTNTLLGHHDNSVLAVDLLAPRPGTHLAVMLPSPVGDGHTSLWHLVGSKVKLALLQLGIAFAVLAIWRSRRLGRPVRERQPVDLAGSELVVAVGNLLERTGRRDVAAGSLRGDFRHWLAQRFGMSPSTPPETLADTGHVRTGAARADLLTVLEERPIAGDAELVELAQLIERLREEVTHGRP